MRPFLPNKQQLPCDSNPEGRCGWVGLNQPHWSPSIESQNEQLKF